MQEENGEVHESNGCYKAGKVSECVGGFGVSEVLVPDIRGFESKDNQTERKENSVDKVSTEPFQSVFARAPIMDKHKAFLFSLRFFYRERIQNGPDDKN